MQEDGSNLPEISVIVPCHNAMAHLPGVSSVLQAIQYPSDRLEVIWVDDGSTDGTGDWLEQQADSLPFPSMVIRQPNQGPSAARNAGLRRAKGEWVQFLDADDWLAPGKILRQARASQSLDSEVAVLHSPWHRRSAPLLICFPHLEHSHLESLLGSSGFVAIGAKLYRKSWLQAVNGYAEDRWFIEDVHLDLRIAIEGGVFRGLDHAESEFEYNDVGDSLSKSNRIGFLDGIVANAQMVEEHWRQTGADLNSARVDLLMGIYDHALRGYAGVDSQRFTSLIGHCRRLSPAWRPASGLVRRLALVLGLGPAHHLVAWARRSAGR